MTLKMTPKDPYLRVLMPKCNYLHFFRSCEQFFVVQSLSCVWLFVTPLTAVCQASLSFTISQSLLKLMSIESVMPSSHLILCCPLLFLPSIFPSIRVFSNESALRIRWPKYWSFSFRISPSNEYSGLISFRMNWFDLLGVQGTLNSLLQHLSSKASVLQHSAFFILQLPHPCAFIYCLFSVGSQTVKLTILWAWEPGLEKGDTHTLLCSHHPAAPILAASSQCMWVDPGSHKLLRVRILSSFLDPQCLTVPSP